MQKMIGLWREEKNRSVIESDGFVFEFWWCYEMLCELNNG